MRSDKPTPLVRQEEAQVRAVCVAEVPREYTERETMCVREKERRRERGLAAAAANGEVGAASMGSGRG